MATTDPLEDRQVIDLWPSVPPGTDVCRATPTVVERSSTLFHPDRALTGIIKPTLTAALPERPNGVSLIVAPGGSFARIVLDKEGREVANWLRALGVTVFLMTYRLPAEGHLSGRDAPLQDGQRAVRLVREHSAGWGLDPARIGFMGFSAAGYIGASLVADFDKKLTEPIDIVDRQSARPDFAVLAYPVVSMEAGVAHLESRRNLLGEDPSPELAAACSPDRHVTSASPQVFIITADDDATVPAANSVRFYMAMKQAGVPAELHVFRDGGHGFALEHATGLPVSRWPLLCEDWMKRIGILR
jgi:acetyl esterase/lipase